MITYLTKIYCAMQTHTSNRIRTKAQFEKINKVKMDIKEDPTVGLLVVSHKQKILQM